MLPPHSRLTADLDKGTDEKASNFERSVLYFIFKSTDTPSREQEFRKGKQGDGNCDSNNSSVKLTC